MPKGDILVCPLQVWLEKKKKKKREREREREDKCDCFFLKY